MCFIKTQNTGRVVVSHNKNQNHHEREKSTKSTKMPRPVGGKNRKGHSAGGKRTNAGRPTKQRQEEKRAEELKKRQQKEERRRNRSTEAQQRLASHQAQQNQNARHAQTRAMTSLAAVCNEQSTIDSSNRSNNVEDEKYFF